MPTAVARLLADLVSRPSVNPMGRALQGPHLYEHQVTAYLEDFFRSLGVPSQRQTVAPQRDNIVATFTPPGATRTVVFEAHQDTVPTDQMTIDPFGARVEGGRLYGRGACDIKGGMTAMLTAFARVVREKPRGACRVVMACSVDEEHTFLGVQALANLDLRGELAGAPIAAVVAEPTNLQIVHAHKGVTRWHLTTRGRSCHSSRPEQGKNAIYHMADVLAQVERYADALRESKCDPLLGGPTLSVGRIEGGTSVNTVPDFCRVEVDRRLIPGEDPAAAPEQLAEWLLACGVGLDRVTWEQSAPWLHCPALAPIGSEEIIARLGEAIDAMVGTHQVLPVPYGTDASTLALAGIPSVVFGPGDIAQAHTCDEWIDLDEVEKASEVLYRLACRG